MSSQLLIQHVPGGVADDVAVDAFFGVPETPYAHPTVRAVREDINSSAAADHTANIPATAQTGDLVVIALANNAGTQTLPPTGWTVVETEYRPTTAARSHSTARQPRVRTQPTPTP
jgi:hypothetical protein